MKKFIVSILLLSFSSQTMAQSISTSNDEGNTLSYSKLLGDSKGNAELIRVELKNHRVRVQSNSMDSQTSLSIMAESFLESKLGFADLDAYVRSSLSEQKYKNFKHYLSVSFKGVDLRSTSPEEFAGILGLALQETNVEGLAWSGCAGTAIGGVLIAATIVVGILAAVNQAKGNDPYNADRNPLGIYSPDEMAAKGEKWKHNAQVLGIVALSMSAPAIYFTIDGALDGACN